MTWVIRGCYGRRTDGWDVSQQFLLRSKDRRLGLDPNSFSAGWRTDAWNSSWLGLEPNSFTVGRWTDAWDLSWIRLEPNSFNVGWRTDVWESSRLIVESINSFGHIVCKEVLCLTVLGTQELIWRHHISKNQDQPIEHPIKPGHLVSVNQLVSLTPGIISEMTGILTTKHYKYATVYVDHVSRLTFAYLQNTATANKTIKGREAFEKYARNQSINIR